MKDDFLNGEQLWWGKIFNISTVENGEMILNLTPDKRCLYRNCPKWVETMKAVFIHIESVPAQKLLASLGQPGHYIGVLGRKINDPELIESAFWRVEMTKFGAYFLDGFQIKADLKGDPKEFFKYADLALYGTNSSTKKH